jgi:NAD(P)H-nitrite reductase large subunit
MHEWCKQQHTRDFTDVQRQFKCGTSCGLCVPYVRRMLRTGETVFHQIVTDRSEPPRA